MNKTNWSSTPNTTLPPADLLGEFWGPNKPVQRQVAAAGCSSCSGEYMFVLQCGTRNKAEIPRPVTGQLELETQSWIQGSCFVPVRNRKQETGNNGWSSTQSAAEGSFTLFRERLVVPVCLIHLLVLSSGAGEGGVISQRGGSVQDHQELLHQLPPLDDTVLLCGRFLQDTTWTAEVMNTFYLRLKWWCDEAKLL